MTEDRIYDIAMPMVGITIAAAIAVPSGFLMWDLAEQREVREKETAIAESRLAKNKKTISEAFAAEMGKKELTPKDNINFRYAGESACKESHLGVWFDAVSAKEASEVREYRACVTKNNGVEIQDLGPSNSGDDDDDFGPNPFFKSF